MANIPLLNFFTFEKMAKHPGLYTVAYSPGVVEIASESLAYHLIAQAIEKFPQKIVIVSFLEPHNVVGLEKFLERQNINAQNVVFCESAEQVISFCQTHPNAVSSIFANNERFFPEPRGEEVSFSYKAKQLQKFTRFVYNSNLVLVMASSVRRTYAPMDEAPEPLSSRLNHSVASTSQGIVGIKEVRSASHSLEVELMVLKNRSSSEKNTIRYSIDLKSKEWKLLTETSVENFFNYKAPNFYLTIKHKKLLTDSPNVDEYFKKYKVPRSIKKQILKQGIIVRGTYNLNEERLQEIQLIEINYDCLNLYEILRRTYNQELNPDLFIANTNLPFSLNLDVLNKLDIERFLKLLPQRTVYQWFTTESRLLLLDSFKLFKDLELKGIELNFKHKPRNPKELHDALVKLSDLNDPKLAEPVRVQNQIKKIHGQSIKLLIGDKEENFSIEVPLLNRDFKAVGKKMGLCIQTEWFWSELETKKHNILFLSQQGIPKFCVEINKAKEIVEAKQAFNHKIDPEILEQIGEYLERTAS